MPAGETQTNSTERLLTRCSVTTLARPLYLLPFAQSPCGPLVQPLTFAQALSEVQQRLRPQRLARRPLLPPLALLLLEEDCSAEQRLLPPLVLDSRSEVSSGSTRARRRRANETLRPCRRRNVGFRCTSDERCSCFGRIVRSSQACDRIRWIRTARRAGARCWRRIVWRR